jgi:hypothetical protein
VRVQIVVLLALWAVEPTEARAQVFPNGNGISLAGVTAFDANITVPIWLNVDGDRDRFVSNAQSAWELGLRRDGVEVSSSSPNFLICSLAVAQSGGTVAVQYGVRYFGYKQAGLHPLLWEGGGMLTVGSDNFEADDIAQNCVDTFANEWLKWNPRE